MLLIKNAASDAIISAFLSGMTKPSISELAMGRNIPIRTIRSAETAARMQSPFFTVFIINRNRPRSLIAF